MDDSIKSELLIANFDCEADEITHTIGIQPTKVIRKGDIKKEHPTGDYPPIRYKRAVWIYNPNLPASESMEGYLSAPIKGWDIALIAISEAAFAIDAYNEATESPYR